MLFPIIYKLEFSLELKVFLVCLLIFFCLCILWYFQCACCTGFSSLVKHIVFVESCMKCASEWWKKCRDLLLKNSSNSTQKVHILQIVSERYLYICHVIEYKAAFLVDKVELHFYTNNASYFIIWSHVCM